MKPRTVIFLFLLALVLWITIDINYPYKTDIKNFNPSEVASLEGSMWRSYYERKKLSLFFQTASLMRKQFHVPFWRSCAMAYHAAKAAFIFKDGKNRMAYQMALPDLTKYYKYINNISLLPFPADKAAGEELEWWIVRRYRNEHPPAEWEKILAQEAETIYHVPAQKFYVYARLSVQAMLLRDNAGDHITENEWQQVDGLLQQAWKSFSDTLHS